MDMDCNENLSIKNLYSHPDKLLTEHLEEVFEFSRRLWERSKCNLPVELSGDKFGKLIGAIAYLHDLGKGTPYFQERLLKGKAHEEGLHRHSLLGAVYFVWRLRDELELDELLLGYLIIRAHHSSLGSSLDSVYKWGRSMRCILSLFPKLDSELSNLNLKRELKMLVNSNPEITLLEPTYRTLSDELLVWVNEKLEGLGFSRKTEIRPRFSELTASLKVFGRRPKEVEDTVARVFSSKGRVKLLYAFSLLISADRYSAAGYHEVYTSPFPFSLKQMEVILNTLSSSSVGSCHLNELRSKAYCEAMEAIEKAPPNLPLILQLPTGLGKTTINLGLASRELYMKNSHLIYTLPFTSIIDQVYDNYRGFSELSGIKDSYSIIKMHHASPKYFEETGEGDELPPDLGLSVFEDWGGAIIITTFVQLFDTILRGKPSPVRKFHRFADSTVILDEPQAIPVKYWELIGEVIDELSRNMNIRFIISTATLPYLIKEGYHLIANPEQYYLNRYNLNLMLDLDNIDDLVQLVSAEILKGKRILVMLNTVASAKEVYRKLKERHGDLSISFLARSVPPIIRSRRLVELMRGDIQVIVSTQVVEAGVDLDVDIAFRDFAPLDSIIQTCGRVNRHGLRGRGEVFLVKLRDPRTKRFYYSYIYDPILTRVTEEVLSSASVISEPDLLNTLSTYFSKVKEFKDTSAFKESWLKGRFDELDKFSLISAFWEIPIYVELDERSRELWLDLKRALRIEDRAERFRRLELIKPKIYSRLVTVGVNKLYRNLALKDKPFWRVPLEDLNLYYNPEVGLDLPEGDGGYILV